MGWLGQIAPTPVTPAPTLTEAPTPTEMPTPYPPPREPLGPENAARVAQLARWGKGWVVEIAFSPDGRLVGWLGVGVFLGGLATLGGMWLGQTMPAAPATPVEIVVLLGVFVLLLAGGAGALSFLLLESGDRHSGWLSVGVIVGVLVTLGVVLVTLGVMRLR